MNFCKKKNPAKKDIDFFKKITIILVAPRQSFYYSHMNIKIKYHTVNRPLFAVKSLIFYIFCNLFTVIYHKLALDHLTPKLFLKLRYIPIYLFILFNYNNKLKVNKVFY